MAWSTIRKATDADKARLQAVEARFTQHHGFHSLELETAIEQGEVWLAPGRTLYRAEALRLRRSYRAAVRRALGCNADGIAYDTVGVSVQ